MVEKIFLPEIRHKKIQIAVIIVIAPGATGGIGDVGDDSPGSYFHEGPITLVVVEKIPLAVVRHEKILIAVVIVIGPAATKGIAVVADYFTSGHTSESAGTVVAK